MTAFTKPRRKYCWIYEDLTTILAIWYTHENSLAESRKKLEIHHKQAGIYYAAQTLLLGRLIGISLEVQ